MKAVVVTPYYHPKIGGLEIYARQLGIALKTIKKWDIVVITSGDHMFRTEYDQMDGMTIYRLPRWFTVSNTPVSLLWPLQIKKIIKSKKPDVILAHTPVPGISDMTALVSGKIPLVVFYHAATLFKATPGMGMTAITWLYYQLQRHLFFKATLIVAVSDYVKNNLPQKVQPKTVVVPNSVWQAQITATKPVPGQNTFLFIGSLKKSHAWKGLDQIILAAKLYKEAYGKNFELLVMGSGDGQGAYQALAAAAGLENNVTFLGQKSGQEKAEIIAKSKAMIIYPTSSNDAFPTVLLEAWASGVPAIVADIEPLKSLVKDGGTGMLVAPSNPRALADAMHRLVTLKQSEASKLVGKARTQTTRNFTWERQAEYFNRLIEEQV